MRSQIFFIASFNIYRLLVQVKDVKKLPIEYTKRQGNTVYTKLSIILFVNIFCENADFVKLLY